MRVGGCVVRGHGSIDIGDRAFERAGALELDLDRLDVAREAEVDDACTPVLVEQHVVGLEVAVNEPLGVRCREPAPRRREDGHNLAPRTRR
ncbi:MAG TPA: hypothetical protein VHJ20_11610 [Polyangia bacterium]|nr:hypothetical protein [Polyangia bacterium]